MTIHINASSDEIAETVFLPGDPLRAKWAAQVFLKNSKEINSVRGMLGYTGNWNGNEVTFQGSGMGMPSLSIYLNELISTYKSKKFIRIGSAGSMQANVKIRDIVLAMTASSISTPSKSIFKEINYAPGADFSLLDKAYKIAKNKKINSHVGGIYSTDTFYSERNDLDKEMIRHGVLAVEMETAELYTLSARYGCSALSILTISDNLLTGDSLPSEDREKTFGEMIEIGLETVFG